MHAATFLGPNEQYDLVQVALLLDFFSFQHCLIAYTKGQWTEATNCLLNVTAQVALGRFLLSEGWMSWRRGFGWNRVRTLFEKKIIQVGLEYELRCVGLQLQCSGILQWPWTSIGLVGGVWGHKMGPNKRHILQKSKTIEGKWPVKLL